MLQANGHPRMPKELALETACVSAALVDPRYFSYARDLLAPTDFFQQRERALFETLCELQDAGQPFDAALLMSYLERAGLVEVCGGVAGIAEILTYGAIPAHMRYYAMQVKEASRARDLLIASERASEELLNGFNPDDVVARLKRDVEKSAPAEVAVDLKETVHRCLDRLEEEEQHGTSLKTDWVRLDKLTGGLAPGQLIIVGGRPGMGKSVLLQNLCVRLAVAQNVLTYCVSLEMSAQEWVDRMIINLASVDATRYRDSKLEPGDCPKVVEAGALIARAPLRLSDAPRQTVDSIHQRAAQVALQGNLGLICVDYLQLIKPDDPKKRRYEQIGQIGQDLKEMGKDLGVPVVAAAQVSREAANRGDKRPRLSDLREGGDIENAADVVLFVHRPGAYSDKARSDEAEFIIAKQRNGGLGTIEMDWIAQHQRFSSPGSEVQDGFWDE